MICLTSRFVSPVVLGLVLLVGSTGSSIAQIDDPVATTAQDSDALLKRARDSTPTPTFEARTPASQQTKEPPQKARDLLSTIQDRQGDPPPGYIGGRAFHNHERRLPKGRYREYDVNPKLRDRPRDRERIVIEERTGKAYYTGDHYRTFIPLN
jgi:guanyl-specific ribonuclease Sa